MDESFIANIGPHSPAAAAVSVFLAGMGFLLFEVFLTYGPAQTLLRRAFAANPKLSPKQVEKRIREANSRLVGTLHLLIQIPCATYVIWTPSIAEDRLHAKTPQSQLLLAISAGYFLYDAFICILRYEGIAYLMHGFLACILYTYGAVTGFLGYYGAMFILWECSTPFVYMRWFLYNFGWADTKVYIYNGLTMLASFFIFRNVVGTAMSVEFWLVSGRQMLNPIPGGVTGLALWFYRLTCLVLNSLNAMWFVKMVQGAMKALRSISATPETEEAVEGTAVHRGAEMEIMAVDRGIKVD